MPALDLFQVAYPFEIVHSDSEETKKKGDEGTANHAGLGDQLNNIIR
jgi:hypothetical protein